MNEKLNGQIAPFLFSEKGVCSMNHDVATEKKIAIEINGTPKKYTMPPPKDPGRCVGCPYPGVGFICWSIDGSCMKTDLDRMHSKKKER